MHLKSIKHLLLPMLIVFVFASFQTKKQIVNQIVVKEDIAKGERVRKFTLEGKTSNGWKTIFEGSCIGHKFIHRFNEVEVSAVRLKILESKEESQILEVSAYKILN